MLCELVIEDEHMSWVCCTTSGPTNMTNLTNNVYRRRQDDERGYDVGFSGDERVNYSQGEGNQSTSQSFLHFMTFHIHYKITFS